MRPSRYALILAVAVLTAGAWSGECRAQAKVPCVGMLILGEAALQMTSNQWFIAKLAARDWVPGKNAVLEYRFASGDGMRFNDSGASTYGPDLIETMQRNAVQVAKILGGANPADLPVEPPTKCNLAVNLKTTKALGLSISESVLLRADEVIR
jgi:ABC transporter substrate binding protein